MNGGSTTSGDGRSGSRVSGHGGSGDDTAQGRGPDGHGNSPRPTNRLPGLADAARAVARPSGLQQAGTPAAADPAAAPGTEGTAPRRPVRIGLVLAGGGAKGAYHNGVLDYLASTGITISAITGASIGALNGAVIAAAPTLREGVERLDALWDEVSRMPVPGLPPYGPADDSVVVEGLPEETTLEQLIRLLPRLGTPAVNPAVLHRLVRENIDPARLRTGIPMWVSAFPALEEVGALRRWGWAVDIVRAQAGADARWLRLSDLDDEECLQAVLASAALPLILPPRRVGGRLYRDGGLADNTPAGPLARFAGCDVAIVVHLNQGLPWDAHDFPGLGIIEIRPSRPPSPGGPLGHATGLIDFSPSRIRRLRAQGRADAERILESFHGLLTGVRGLRAAERDMLRSVRRLLEADGSEPPSLR